MDAPVRSWLNVLLLVLACACPALSQEPAGAKASPASPPAVPEAYESPRATLITFLEAMGALKDDPRNADEWARVFGALDQPRARPEAIRRDEAYALLFVFNAIGEIVPGTMAPDKEYADAQKLKSFEFFPDNAFARQHDQADELFEEAIAKVGRPPPAEIRLVRLEDGRWKFSAETLDQIGLLQAWARPLGVTYGQDVRGQLQSEVIRRWIPAQLQDRFFLGIELWQWVGLALAIFIALLADVIGRQMLAPVVGRLVNRYIAIAPPEEVRDTLRPVGLAIGAALFLALVRMLGLVGMPATIMSIAGRLVLTVGVVWAAWSFTDLAAGAFLRRPKTVKRAFDDMLVPLLRKTAKMFILAMGLIYIADTFGVELLPLLASFGIAGLAISFAAQDMVKNLFGGLTIFLDQPFRVGERVNYKGFEGTIEEIGFRITRMRTLTGHLVTIPNGGITNDPVENIARRPSIRRVMNITITYDTPREKIEQAVQIVRGIFEEPGIREPIHQYLNGELMAPRVFFNQFNADSLNIFAIYWHIPPDWWAYNEHAQRINLRLIEEFTKAGIEFAFPTQTLFLAKDPNRWRPIK